MYTSVTILTIVYTIVLLYIYIRYNLDAKDKLKYDIYREKLEISASEAAYLLNKNCEGLDIILANILTLIEKDYIEMNIIGEGKERNYIFIKKENADNMKLKSHEMSAYRLFFGDKTKVDLKEYLKDLYNNSKCLEELEMKVHSIKHEIEFELRKQGITDVTAEKKLFKFNKMSIIFILIYAIAFGILTIFTKNLEYIEFTLIGLLFSILLNRTTNIKEDKLTKYGVEVKRQAQGFRKFLETNVITDNKPLYMVNILEYNYIMAVAFGMAKLGQNEFVHNTYKQIETGKVIARIAYIIIIICIILINLM